MKANKAARATKTLYANLPNCSLKDESKDYDATELIQEVGDDV